MFCVACLRDGLHLGSVWGVITPSCSGKRNPNTGASADWSIPVYSLALFQMCLPLGFSGEVAE